MRSDPRQGDGQAADARPRARGRRARGAVAARRARAGRARSWPLDPPQRRRRRVDARQAGCCCARARCSRCCWCSRTCTGSTRETQAVLDSLVESLPAARPSCSPSTTGRSTGTAGAARPTIASSASTRCRRRAPTRCSGPSSAPTRRLAPLTPLLIARTEGNPLFLEESVRTLVETGALVGEPRRLPARPARGDASRCRRRSRRSSPRASIACARSSSACSRPPPSSARTCRWRCSLPSRRWRTTRCSAALGELQTAELLYEARLFPDLEYTFKHALTHEVAYNGVLQERRRALHARDPRGARAPARRPPRRARRGARAPRGAGGHPRQGRPLSARGGAEGGRPLREPGGGRLLRARAGAPRRAARDARDAVRCPRHAHRARHCP